MQPKLAALLTVADVNFTWSLSMDLGFRPERVNQKHRPCSSLTFEAITDMDQNWFAVCLRPQRAAGTLSDPGHAGSFLTADRMGIIQNRLGLPMDFKLIVTAIYFSRKSVECVRARGSRRRTKTIATALGSDSQCQTSSALTGFATSATWENGGHGLKRSSCTTRGVRFRI